MPRAMTQRLRVARPSPRSTKPRRRFLVPHRAHRLPTRRRIARACLAMSPRLLEPLAPHATRHLHLPHARPFVDRPIARPPLLRLRAVLTLHLLTPPMARRAAHLFPRPITALAPRRARPRSTPRRCRIVPRCRANRGRARSIPPRRAASASRSLRRRSRARPARSTSRIARVHPNRSPPSIPSTTMTRMATTMRAMAVAAVMADLHRRPSPSGFAAGACASPSRHPRSRAPIADYLDSRANVGGVYEGNVGHRSRQRQRTGPAMTASLLRRRVMLSHRRRLRCDHNQRYRGFLVVSATRTTRAHIRSTPTAESTARACSALRFTLRPAARPPAPRGQS